MSSALHNNFFFYCYLWLEVFFPNHWSPFSILFCFSAMSEFLKCGTWKLGYLATACVGIAVQLPFRVSPQSPRASQKFFLYLDPSSRWPFQFLLGWSQEQSFFHPTSTPNTCTSQARAIPPPLKARELSYIWL